MKLPLIFYAKIEKKNLNTKYMIKILHCHWLNKDKYNLGKLNFTMLWVLVTIYVKEYKAFVPSYNLPKIKKKKKLNTKMHDQDTSLSLIEQRYIQSW